MKIKKFESHDHMFDHFDKDEKILKVEFQPAYLRVEDIEQTDIYKDHIEGGMNRKDALYYGIDEYLYEHNLMYKDFEMYDGDGNKIEDEKLYDETKKFNL